MQKNEEIVGKLLFDIPHRYASNAFQKLMSHGVHPGQIPVLKYLSDNSGCIQGEIAKALRIKPPTVTVTLKRLEKNGLIRKQSDEKDQRVTRIFLTEQGTKVYETMIQSYRYSVEKIMQDFSDEEQDQLTGFLDRICNNIDRVFAESGSFCDYQKKGEEK